MFADKGIYPYLLSFYAQIYILSILYYKLGNLMKKGLILISCYLVLGLTTAGMAGQIDSYIDQIQSDIVAGQSASKKIPLKDARLVPVPIPIINPSIGAGLAAALFYTCTRRKAKIRTLRRPQRE